MYRIQTILKSLGSHRQAALVWSAQNNVTERLGVSATSATTKYYSTKEAQESFLNGSSSSYVEEMYNNWLRDPATVHSVSIAMFFLILT